MTEHALLTIAGIVSLLAIAAPAYQLAVSLLKQAFPRALVVKNEQGVVLGMISAETVRESSKTEIVQLHERMRRSKNVSVEAA